MRARLMQLIVVVLLAASILPGLSTHHVRADWYPPTTVWVESTGHTVDGRFLDAWRGAKALLGDPISEERSELVQLAADDEPIERTIQYFTGGALVYLPDQDAVVTMPLGYWALTSDVERYPSRHLPAPESCDGLPENECAVFADTGYSLRQGFKAFWDTNGGPDLIGAPISEPFTDRDGVPIQYFENAVLRREPGKPIAPRALGQELAVRQQAPLDHVPQPDDVPVYHEELFIAPLAPDMGVSDGESTNYGPGPLRGAWRELVISRGSQTLWAYEDGELVLTTLVSTGVGNVPETVTPLGEWAIHTKLELQTMEGVIAGEHYLVEDVPWVMYFDDRADALHGAYWHNNFGQPMSHGCVNLPLDIAEYLYAWADIGTPVTIVE